MSTTSTGTNTSFDRGTPAHSSGGRPINLTPCGDIYNPPSRNNMSLFAIIEVVIMGVIAILCLLEFIDCLGNFKNGYSTIQTLILIDDVIIVVAVCYLVYGLFFVVSSRNIRIGILLFVLGGILAMVVIILQINNSTGKNILYKLFEFIIILFLTWVLWNQAARV